MFMCVCVCVPVPCDALLFHSTVFFCMPAATTHSLVGRLLMSHAVFTHVVRHTLAVAVRLLLHTCCCLTFAAPTRLLLLSVYCYHTCCHTSRTQATVVHVCARACGCACSVCAAVNAATAPSHALLPHALAAAIRPWMLTHACCYPFTAGSR